MRWKYPCPWIFIHPLLATRTPAGSAPGGARLDRYELGAPGYLAGHGLENPQVERRQRIPVEQAPDPRGMKIGSGTDLPHLADRDDDKVMKDG